MSGRHFTVGHTACVTLLICIRNAPGSNLYRVTASPEVFVILLGHSVIMLGWYLKCEHDCFLPAPSNSLFTIVRSLSAVWPYWLTSSLITLQIQIHVHAANYRVVILATFSAIRVMCIGFKYSYQLALVVFANWLSHIQNIVTAILFILSTILLLDNRPEIFFWVNFRHGRLVVSSTNRILCNTSSHVCVHVCR